MKKVKLNNVDLTELSNFIGKLTPLNETSTVFFKLDKNYLSTDSHNDSATIVKCIRKEISSIVDENNITEDIKLCFYDGKKVVRALSFLSGNEVSCEISYDIIEGENFAQQLKISSSKMNIVIDAADPSLIEFANVPEDAIASLSDVSDTSIKFDITSNELLKLHKMLDFDTSSEIVVNVSDKVTIGIGNSFDLRVDDDFSGIENKKTFKISKDLFKLIDETEYSVYVNEDDYRIILKSADNQMTVVVTLNEDIV